MNVLGINGSERAGGNTEQALARAAGIVRARGGEFTEIRLRDKRFLPCGTCGDCNYRAEPCELDDDMAAIVDEMVRADGIIYATPVHGFGMAHLMQIFVERAGVGYLRFRRPLANKVGGIIVTARRFSDVDVHNQLALNLLLNRMILVGSGFPAVLRGGTRGEALTDVDGVDALDRMVHRMVDMMELLDTHQTLVGGAMLPLPEDNERAIGASRGVSVD